jgi:hypothetical protein
MRTKIIIFILICLAFGVICAHGQTPSEIKYRIWDLHALRYYPNKTNADSIMVKVMENIPEQDFGKSETQTTYIDLAANQEFLGGLMAHSKMKNNLFQKLLFNPYRDWFDRMEPITEGKTDKKLTLSASGESPNESSYEGIFNFPGNYTITQLANDVIGDMSIYRKKNDVALNLLSGPLAKEAVDHYQFFLFGETVENGIPCYEVAFFSKKQKDRATEGLLYIDKEKYTVVKAVLTVNFSLEQDYAKNILMVHYFNNGVINSKENYLFVGDDATASFLISQKQSYQKQPEAALMPATPPIVATANATPAWRNASNIAALFLTGNIGLGKHPKLEVGPLLQTVSYNKMESVRLRLGLNTTTNLNNRFAVGGYVAYGIKDEKWKYRGDVHYSLKPKHDSLHEFPASLFSFTYAEDLNIPGQDMLTSTRDRLTNSFYHSSVRNMAWQKIARLSYRQEFSNRLSFEVSGKYLSDKPMGMMQYQPFATTEVGLLFRYAPHEKTMQMRNRRRFIRHGDMEVKFNHRMGMEGVFGSDFNYHITTLSVRKQFLFPANVGSMNISLSGGKVWDSLPFPLLFIPEGNQGYIMDDNEYNLMKYSEFVTDQYLLGNLSMQFNWSPVSLFLPKWNIRTHIGFKALYGPLSDKNNPELHPSLSPFNNGISPLGDKPYMEASIGLSNIFRVLRIEYVRRLTYTDDARKGSVFVGTGMTF